MHNLGHPDREDGPAGSAVRPEEVRFLRGTDAPMERRDLLLIVALLGTVFPVAGIAAVLAALVGWV
jgi:hypothetical protein